MKLWSRGLGRTEVGMDFRYYKITKDSQTGHPIIVGNMQEPVTWEFTLKLEPDDIAGIVKMLFSVSLLWFVIKNLFRYPIYLLNRKKYVVEGEESLEKRVLGTYEKMMSRTPRKKRSPRRRAVTAEENPTHKKAA